MAHLAQPCQRAKLKRSLDASAHHRDRRSICSREDVGREGARDARTNRRDVRRIHDCQERARVRIMQADHSANRGVVVWELCMHLDGVDTEARQHAWKDTVAVPRESGIGARTRSARPALEFEYVMNPARSCVTSADGSSRLSTCVRESSSVGMSARHIMHTVYRTRHIDASCRGSRVPQRRNPLGDSPFSKRTVRSIFG